MTMRRFALAAAIAILPLGCSGDETTAPTPEGCSEANLVGDVCAGVPTQKLCEGAACAPASCNTSTVVTNDADLATALAGASDGSCIVLSPGNYAQIDLPAVRVGLYAESAEDTAVGTITVSGGANTEISGLTAAGLVVLAGDVRLDAVRIADSGQDGVRVDAGASVRLDRSEILRAGRYGVAAFDSDSVTMDSTVIAESAGPGVWMQCSDGMGTPCSCNTDLTGSITNTKITGAKIVGISIVDASVTIDNVEVRETTVGANFEAGGGVSIAHCSDVTANNLSVLESADFGILVHDSTFDMTGGQVSENLRGVWMQFIGQSQPGYANLTGVTLDGNLGVGIGVDGGAQSVTVTGTAVENTASISLPVLVNGVSAASEEVGDGVAWLGLSQVVLDSVTVTNSARTGLLIDGDVSAGSSITNLTLNEDGEKANILHQNVTASGTTPVTSGTVPSVTTTPDEVYAVPDDVVPPGI
jgi:Right handed beta helix region